jgi:4'-phosphopantetheinyl transferase
LNTSTQIDWPVATSWPALDDQAVHVWATDFAAWRDDVDSLLSLLSPDERHRAESFRHGARRETAIVTRGLLRKLLAKYHAPEAGLIQFRYGVHGKPLLEDTNFHFNTSHSHDLVVFAFTRAGEVGVDIERIRADTPRLREIAEKYFAPGELKPLLAMPDAERTEAFFRCWTRKEAFLKARGDGVFGGLNKFEVSLDEKEARLLRVDGELNSRRWSMAPLHGIGEHAGAVVVRAPECRLSCWRLSPQIFHGTT